MTGFFKALSAVVCAVSIAVFSLVYIFDRRIPDEFTAASYSDLEKDSMLRLNLDGTDEKGPAARYNVNVSILDVIPVKSSVLKLNERKYVVPGGDVIGLKLYTRGIAVVGTEEILSGGAKVNPSRSAGIRKGDSILSIDGVEVESVAEAAGIFSSSGGNTMRLVCERNGEKYETDLYTVKCDTDGRYKAGLWIRDSAAGIGTMTYYDTDNGVFASLGHAVCDIDTGKTVNVSSGECVRAEITGCNKGVSGRAGELCGVFADGSLGEVLVNCESGAYGRLASVRSTQEKIPVASGCEVKTGYAQIISTVDSQGAKKYDVEITKLYSPSADENRCMTIRITDPELIEKTGGIVQGMSGSPIIQNGMLVGAVTHVFINDPTQGYGIFAQRMLSVSSEAEMNPQAA